MTKRLASIKHTAELWYQNAMTVTFSSNQLPEVTGSI